MKPPKPTTAAERELCESILRRMMAELDAVYINVATGEGDSITLAMATS